MNTKLKWFVFQKWCQDLIWIISKCPNSFLSFSFSYALICNGTIEYCRDPNSSAPSKLALCQPEWNIFAPYSPSVTLPRKIWIGRRTSKWLSRFKVARWDIVQTLHIKRISSNNNWTQDQEVRRNALKQTKCRARIKIVVTQNFNQSKLNLVHWFKNWAQINQSVVENESKVWESANEKLGFIFPHFLIYWSTVWESVDKM